MRLPIRLSTAAIAVVAATLSTVLLGGISVTQTDPERFDDIGDGLWWAATTITTVGYGDLVPISAEGRLVGSVLMFVGIACVAMLTAIAASAMVAVEVRSEEEAIERDEVEVLTALRELNHRLDRLEKSLRAPVVSTNRQLDRPEQSMRAPVVSTNRQPPTEPATRPPRNWEDEV